MHHKRSATLLAAAVMLVGGALATAAPASAAPAPPDGSRWDHTFTSVDSNHGATMYVEEHGDVIELCDSASDGYAARAIVSGNPSLSGTLTYTMTSSGAGVCTVHTASQGGAYDLPEVWTIYVKLWVGTKYLGEKQYSFLNDL
ncbi:hypothetical protein OHA18_11670 [Kribbella sp. NBC_00709]|uniref:hypothetical protein n=1 Tax=Kribbella sp. NBC_00709 TaxID=2975972 RepID=UPI002E2BEF1C|nr:hypothetical protein [Kribbella sp. NBC_00709]